MRGRSPVHRFDSAAATVQYKKKQKRAEKAEKASGQEMGYKQFRDANDANGRSWMQSLLLSNYRYQAQCSSATDQDALQGIWSAAERNCGERGNCQCHYTHYILLDISILLNCLHLPNTTLPTFSLINNL